MPEHRIHAFIWHPTDHAFLTLDGALPVYAPEKIHAANTPGWVAERLGLTARPLLKADLDDTPAEEHLLVLEALAPPERLPTGARWTDRAEGVSDLPGVAGRVADLLTETVPDARPPWARRGWQTGVEAWINGHVARTGPIQSVKSWCLSCVLKVPTEGGDVYFKVSNDRPLFANEATVTQGLARLFPGRIPDPIAINAARGWLLLPDIGAPVGFDGDNLPVLTDFAQLQIDAAAHADALLSAGCLDRRPSVLDSQIQTLLTADDGIADLTDAEIERLNAALPALRARCARLADGPLPLTLVHGDLHGGNVAPRPGGGFVYFDWTDACLGAPPLDLLACIFEKDDAKAQALRDAYFDVWGVAEGETLWRDARTVLHLHHAVSYWHIERAQEPWNRSQMAGTRVHMLRGALESL